MLQRRVMPYFALLPMLATVCLAYLGAFAWTFYVSLTNSRSIASSKFVGMAQYERLFNNERWLLSLNNLVIFGVLFILACMVIGFLLAACIDRQVTGEGALRTVFLYPYAMSFVATGLVWQWIFTPRRPAENASARIRSAPSSPGKTVASAVARGLPATSAARKRFRSSAIPALCAYPKTTTCATPRDVRKSSTSPAGMR